MPRPPFPLARSSLLGGPAGHEAGPGCCAPGPTPRAPGRQRATLADLDAHFHCSIIGTCLSTGDLRRAVQRAVPLDKGASDIDIHHEAVSLAHRGGTGAREIQKALEQRHGATVRQFAAAADAEAVLAMWNAALASGDIAGAYWAAITHPAVSVAVRQKAFGDVHMLSHLVGAANRADIRRLVALEAENEALKDQLARQQQRTQEAGAEQAAALQDAGNEIATLRGHLQAARDEVASATAPAVRAALVDAQARRIATTEAREAQANAELAAAQADAESLRAQLAASQAETRALEALVASLQDAGNGHGADLPALANRQIVYVGGRPGTIPLIRALVERAGGRLQDHDGGMEDRKGLLPAMVAAADVVVFPVDCVDHDSVSALKRVCQHLGIRYYPVRSASVASFVELMRRLPAMGA